jgi:chromate reductase
MRPAHIEMEGSFDMAKYEVGYLVGSLSSTSINRLLSRALVQLAPSELRLTEIPIRDLPIYSQDYDAGFPPVAQSFSGPSPRSMPCSS